MNNRKQTKGRRIQVIHVPETIVKVDPIRGVQTIQNPHPKAGKAIQVRHKK